MTDYLPPREETLNEYSDWRRRPITIATSHADSGIIGTQLGSRELRRRYRYNLGKKRYFEPSQESKAPSDDTAIGLSYAVGAELALRDPEGYGETLISPEQTWETLIPLMTQQPVRGEDGEHYMGDVERVSHIHQALEEMEGTPEDQQALLRRAMAQIGIDGFTASNPAKVFTRIWEGPDQR